MTIRELKNSVMGVMSSEEIMIKESKKRRAICKYALEILSYYQNGHKKDDGFDINHTNVKELLSGAKDWQQYSRGGCSLIYTGDIEERIGKGGDLIKRQGEYLCRAYNMIADLATMDELDYNWLPSVMMI